MSLLIRYMIGFLLTCLLTFHPAYSQHENDLPIYRNEILGEVLGSGIPYSLNYSRLILQKGKMQFWFKAGGGYFGQFRNILNIADHSMVSSNIEPKIIIGNGRNRFEAGLGYLFVYWFDITECDPKMWNCHEFSHIKFTRIGYRHYSKNNRWVFSIGWTPVHETLIDFTWDYSGDILPKKSNSFHWLYGGIGIGWRF